MYPVLFRMGDFEVTSLGVMVALAAPAADSRNRRDCTLTTVWALSMDAVAAGLIRWFGAATLCGSD